MPILSAAPKWGFLLAGLALCGVAACAPTSAPVPTYVVFFSALSSELDEPAQAVVSDAAKAGRRVQNATVVVEGYADQVGMPAEIIARSRSRAENVAAQLVADGVPRSRITLEPKGAVGDMDPGVASRRVEIEVRGNPR